MGAGQAGGEESEKRRRNVLLYPQKMKRQLLSTDENRKLRTWSMDHLVDRSILQNVHKEPRFIDCVYGRRESRAKFLQA
jgi:hypothetical protein